jgi:hypothetical protein
MVVLLPIAVCLLWTVPVLLPHIIMTHFNLVLLMTVATIHVLPNMMTLLMKITHFILEPWMTVVMIHVLCKMRILMINHFLLKVLMIHSDDDSGDTQCDDDSADDVFVSQCSGNDN